MKVWVASVFSTQTAPTPSNHEIFSLEVPKKKLAIPKWNKQPTSSEGHHRNKYGLTPPPDFEFIFTHQWHKKRERCEMSLHAASCQIAVGSEEKGKSWVTSTSSVTFNRDPLSEAGGETLCSSLVFFVVGAFELIGWHVCRSNLSFFFHFLHFL